LPVDLRSGSLGHAFIHSNLVELLIARHTSTNRPDRGKLPHGSGLAPWISGPPPGKYVWEPPDGGGEL